MVNWELIFGGIGAVAIISRLFWNISNSRSKVKIDRLAFRIDRDHPFKDKECVEIIFTLKNKGDKSTTIESAGVEIGNLPREIFNHLHTKEIKSNSSESFKFRLKILKTEFDWATKEKPVRLGITINHTFGTLKKDGLSDFSRDSLLNL